MRENIELCQLCSGACCKTLPGIAVPKEFGSPKSREETIKRCIVLGRWCIDYTFEGDIPLLVVRPAIKGREDSIFDATLKGICTFLIEGEGCGLPPDRRPWQCKMLMPAPFMGCSFPELKKPVSVIVGKAWKPCQKLLKTIKERG